MTPEADVAVVGAGVVGLATAAALAAAGRSVVVVERNAGIAQEVTARNSEVIHAGIYYPQGSLKAELCVAGRRALYERCERLGKLIVAVADDELPALEDLHARAHANGVPEVAFIDAAEVRRREPDVSAVGALDSPVTGIVDAHALSLSFAAEAERHGALIAMQTEVHAIESIAGGYRIAARGGDGAASDIVAAAVVNAAGLASDRWPSARVSMSTPAATGCTRARATTSRSRRLHRCGSSGSSTRFPLLRVSGCTPRLISAAEFASGRIRSTCRSCATRSMRPRAPSSRPRCSAICHGCSRSGCSPTTRAFGRNWRGRAKRSAISWSRRRVLRAAPHS